MDQERRRLVNVVLKIAETRHARLEQKKRRKELEKEGGDTTAIEGQLKAGKRDDPAIEG